MDSLIFNSVLRIESGELQACTVCLPCNQAAMLLGWHASDGGTNRTIDVSLRSPRVSNCIELPSAPLKA
jgi:hypothetical protein